MRDLQHSEEEEEEETLFMGFYKTHLLETLNSRQGSSCRQSKGGWM